MSKREVEVLLEGHRGQIAGRTRSARGREMATSPDRDQLEQLKAELAAALADRDKKARQVAELTAEVEATQAELARVTSVSGEQIDGLAKELDNERVKSEACQAQSSRGVTPRASKCPRTRARVRKRGAQTDGSLGR